MAEDFSCIVEQRIRGQLARSILEVALDCRLEGEAGSREDVIGDGLRMGLLGRMPTLRKRDRQRGRVEMQVGGNN